MNRFEFVSPASYTEYSVVAAEAALQMCARLDWMTLQPLTILDLSSRDGKSAALLKKRYPAAEVVGMDAVFSFLQFARNNQKEVIHWLSGDVNQLPFKEYAVDFIFANLLLPWCQDWKKILQEWQRILKPNGLLMFTALGPSTLAELAGKISPESALYLMEMHDLGDVLLAEGFRDPVLDVEQLQLNYQSLLQLRQELQGAGFLTEQDSQRILLEKNAAGGLPLNFEVIYGHAWGRGAPQGYTANEQGEVRVPLSSLKKPRMTP